MDIKDIIRAKFCKELGKDRFETSQKLAGPLLEDQDWFSKGIEDLAELKDAQTTAEAEGRVVVRYIISDASVDRHGDTVDVDGWKLKDYKGVMLWAHDHSQPAIGKAVKTWRYGGQLKSLGAFAAKDENPFGHSIGQMVKSGLIPDVSVGFVPFEAQLSEDEERQARHFYPIDFKSQELIEWSPVNVGANRNVFIDELTIEEAKSFGIDTVPLAQKAEQMLDTRRDLESFARKELEKSLFAARMQEKVFSLWKK